jgi:hypothetical protein
MKYATEKSSGATICIPSFIKISSGIQKLIWGVTDTRTAWKSHKPILIFFSKIKTTNKHYLCIVKVILNLQEYIGLPTYFLFQTIQMRRSSAYAIESYAHGTLTFVIINI